MIAAVADSGPFVHLAVVNQTVLLPRYFQPLLILPQVYDEVAIQGRGRSGAAELADHHLTDQVRHVPSGVSDVSDADVMVVALAIEQHAIMLSDDGSLRLLAMAHGVLVIGSIGIGVWARLDGVISALKPLLDQLIASGFHLDPHGRVYQDALRRVGEQ
jgi:predicted nucleic acid-binding protein